MRAGRCVFDLIDFAKVDLMLTTPEQRQEIVRTLTARQITPIAEKVETHGQFREMQALGFPYFQGFFFATPEIVTGHDIGALKVNYLRLLKAINEPQHDLKELERLMKFEEAFCYKLLRFLNSPVFGFNSAIRSVHHAISLLENAK